LDTAFTRVLKEERRGRILVPDILCFSDYVNDKQKILDTIITALKSNSYTPKGLMAIDVPNDNYWIRPGAVPLFQDSILYNALAYYIGEKVNSKLCPTVFSSRFSSHGDLYPAIRQWRNFEGAFWNSVQASNDSSYIVITDITSYFTNINLATLKINVSTLLGNPTRANQKILDVLFDKLLLTWAAAPMHPGFGIPQGADASSIISNLFLHHVDDRISRIRGLKFFRYADDMRFVAKDKITAKVSLGSLIKVLRSIGLDINKSKTKVLSKQEAIRILPDPLSADFDKIEKLIKKKNLSSFKESIPLLEQIFDYSVGDKDPLYQRHISFVINRLILLRKYLSKNNKFIDRVSRVLLSKLEPWPGCTSDIARFIRYFPNADRKRLIIGFLKSKDNIYNWQAMYLLDALLRFNSRCITEDDIDYFEEVTHDDRAHTLCRSKAILLIGKFGNQHRRHDLISIYDSATDTIIKRAIIVGCQQLATAEKERFYSIVKKDVTTQCTIKYVGSLAKPRYFEEEEWAPYDIPDTGTY